MSIKELLDRYYHIPVIAALIFLGMYMVTFEIGKEQIKIWDESSSAKNAVEMLSSGHYFIVHSDGQPDHGDVKPPLQLWLKVLSFKLFGINEFAVRFPTIVAAFGIMLMMLLLSYQLKNRNLGIGILYLMALTPGFMYYHVARHGDTDTLLLFFISGYYTSFLSLLEHYPKRKNLWFFLLGLFVVLATYTKGVAGLAPMAGMPLFFFLYKKHWPLLRDYRLYLTVFLVICTIFAYYILREILDPGYLKAVYERRFKVTWEYPGRVKHPEFSFYYNYLKTFAFLPWIKWLPLAVVPLIFSKNQTLKRVLVFSMITATVFLLGQSSLVMKNEWYIAPIYLTLWVWLAISATETIRLLLQFFKKWWLQYLLIAVLSVWLGKVYAHHYEIIFERNKQDDRRYIYPPERAGHYLRGVMERHDTIREITIPISHHTRQLKFYTLKHNYLEGIKFNIVKNVDTNMKNQFVLTTEDQFKKKLESMYHYQIVDTAKYGIVYYTDSLRKTAPSGKNNPAYP